jgi:hypothetical protein
MNFAVESVSLMADNFLDDVVTFHRSGEMLKMLSIYTQTFIIPEEGVLLYSLKFFCRKILSFFTNHFFQFLFLSGVTVVKFVPQTTSE